MLVAWMVYLALMAGLVGLLCSQVVGLICGRLQYGYWILVDPLI